jgi:hypothetical protein
VSEREDKEYGEVVINITVGGGEEQESISPVLRAPRQRPLVILVGVIHVIRTKIFI